MVWWPFAPKPERADTAEVTGLHSGAPPLYSVTSSENGGRRSVGAVLAPSRPAPGGAGAPPPTPAFHPSLGEPQAHGNSMVSLSGCG